jgi:YfiH family protein
MTPAGTADDFGGHAPASWLKPAFSSPRVGALMTCRHGGVSTAPFDSLNLRPDIGDLDAAVAINRARLHAAVGSPSLLLQQVHGSTCLRLTREMLLRRADTPLPVADAGVCTETGLACEVQVADCLPVLMADRHGRGVAAAHAGWRGLAGGVVQATLAALCDASRAQAADIEVWLGACIGPSRFEVGADVLTAFGAAPASCFVPNRTALMAGCAVAADLVASRAAEPQAQGPVDAKWLADLPALARWTLRQAGVREVRGNDGSPAWCTARNSDFFSYRRDRGRTGRMAACIWLQA